MPLKASMQTRIIDIFVVLGTLPHSMLSMLFPTDYEYNQFRMLIRNNYIKQLSSQTSPTHITSEKTYRLSKKGLNYYCSWFEKQTSGRYELGIELPIKSKNPARIERNNRIAETLIMTYLAGYPTTYSESFPLDILYAEQTKVFDALKSKNVKPTLSLEIEYLLKYGNIPNKYPTKFIGTKSEAYTGCYKVSALKSLVAGNSFRASRATAILVSPNQSFICYSLKKSTAEYSSRSEGALRIFVARLCYDDVLYNVPNIIFGDNMETATEMLHENRAARLGISNDQKTQYFIPKNRDGIKFLRFLQNYDWQTKLNNHALKIAGAVNTHPNQIFVGYGVKGEGIINLLTCDLKQMSRVKKYLQIQLQNQLTTAQHAKPRIVCLDYFEDVIAKYFKSFEIDIIKTNLDEIEGGSCQ